MISFDTNIFVYSVDQSDPRKQSIVERILRAADPTATVVGLQVIGEFQNALQRRLKMPPWAAAQAARNVLAKFGSFPYDQPAVESALAQSAAGRLSYWDALLVASADAAGVTALITEDMADGSVHGAVEIINPFGPSGPSARIQQLLTIR
jgi:predicted nucleic acid-binding protein